jgi:hypothetical protein
LRELNAVRIGKFLKKGFGGEEEGMKFGGAMVEESEEEIPFELVSV